jgi:hypothetical protein
LPEGSPEAFDRLLEIILLFLHVLDSLVPFAEETLEPADFCEQTTTNFKREFYGN